MFIEGTVQRKLFQLQMDWSADNILVFLCLLTTPILSNAYCVCSVDDINCISTMFCTEYVDIDACYNNYGDEIYSEKVSLKYKTQVENPVETLPIFQNEDPVRYRTSIIRFDLSENKYNVMPPLSDMPNLQFLDLSGNHITTAKLSNIYKLPALKDINLSNNMIRKIEMDSQDFIYEKLNKLNLSCNHLLTVPDGAFEKFSELQSLDLSHNFINMLNMLTFEGIKKLSYLNLSYNLIVDINFALLWFNSLEELYLDHNNIEAIKMTDFEKLRNLKILSLSSNAIVDLQMNSFQNTYNLKIIDLSENKIETINKTIFFNTSKLERVNLSRNKLKILPKTLLANKNITFFSIEDNVLEGSLSKGTFEGLEQIVELNLSNQNLTAIEDNAFFGLESLLKLLLNHNSIQSVSRKSFKSLIHLTELDLSNNKLKNIEFDTDDFTVLEFLSLRGNYITEVSEIFFDNLNALTFLDISSNNISNLNNENFKSLNNLTSLEIFDNPLSGDFQQNTFHGLNSLPTLDMSNTFLNNIRNYSLNGMEQLRKLNLSHGEINLLEFNAFTNTGVIEIIDLSYNRLKHYFINTTDLVNLNTLILENNMLKVFSYNSFQNLTSLRKIMVSHNYLETIQDEIFLEQKKLVYLDLSFNKNLKINIKTVKNICNLLVIYLSGISEYTVTFNNTINMRLFDLGMSHLEITNITNIGLNRLKDLEILDLSHNNISQIEVEAFDKVSNLTRLDVSFNKIAHIEPGAFKSNTLLDTLNISHNLLTSISYGIFRGLNYLRTVDISYNQIDNLQSERFYEVQSLEELIADNNKIHTLSPNEFYSPNFKRLSIGGNPIPCKILVSFKNNNHRFALTAINLNDRRNENVDGITCNFDGNVVLPKNNFNKENTLFEIRNILQNWTNRNINEPHAPLSNNDTFYLAKLLEIESNQNEKISKMSVNHDNFLKIFVNLSSIIENKSNTFMTKILDIFSAENKINENENNKTNALMTKLLEILTAKNTVVFTSVAPIETTTNKNVTLNSDMKQALEAAIAVERQYILEEVNKKLSLLDIINSSSIVSKNDKILPDYQISQSSVFTEVCVGLILVIMCVFILYSLYKMGMFKRRLNFFSDSSSTHHIAQSMESANL